MLLVLLIICLLFIVLKTKGFFNKVDDIREPISVNEIDWKYFSKMENSIKVESIVVYSPGHTFGISTQQSYLFAKLMLKNPNEIYVKPNSHSLKIHFIFNEAYVINGLYTIDKYNGKDSNFYVNKSLVSELKKIYYTPIEKINDDRLYNNN